jgi:peptidoglycan hydrolase CwlO-like protein
MRLVFICCAIIISSAYFISSQDRILQEQQTSLELNTWLDEVTEVLLSTEKRLIKTEDKLVECVDYVKQLRATNTLQEAVVENTAATVKELTDDNAELQKELDSVSTKFSTTLSKLIKTQTDVKSLDAKIQKLTAENAKLTTENIQLRKAANTTKTKFK